MWWTMSSACRPTRSMYFLILDATIFYVWFTTFLMTFCRVSRITNKNIFLLQHKLALLPSIVSTGMHWHLVKSLLRTAGSLHLNMTLTHSVRALTLVQNKETWCLTSTKWTPVPKRNSMCWDLLLFHLKDKLSCMYWPSLTWRQARSNVLRRLE